MNDVNNSSVALGMLIAVAVVLLLAVSLLVGVVVFAVRAVSRTATLTVERTDGKLKFTGSLVATQQVASVVTDLEIAQAVDQAERAKRPLLAPKSNGSSRASEQPS